MIDINKFKKTPMGEALIKLSEKMNEKNVPPITINAIGGFALMMDGTRDMDCVTDIDYIGKELPEDIAKLVDDVGSTTQMGTGWINNQNLYPQNTIEGLKYEIGDLHFTEAMKIGNITINALDSKEVLRMKIIALDSSLCGMSSEGALTRKKDLPDIKALLEKHKIEPTKIEDEYFDCLIHPLTARVIRTYVKKGMQPIDEFEAKSAAKAKANRDRINERILETKEKEESTPKSSFNLSAYLNNAFKEANSTTDYSSF